MTDIEREARQATIRTIAMVARRFGPAYDAASIRAAVAEQLPDLAAGLDAAAAGTDISEAMATFARGTIVGFAEVLDAMAALDDEKWAKVEARARAEAGGAAE